MSCELLARWNPLGDLKMSGRRVALRLTAHSLKLIALPCLLAGCSAAQPSTAKVYRCEVVNAFSHDTNAFTQGLAYFDGKLYEGTGLNGRSSIRRVELASGKVLQQRDLPRRYFGEGSTLWGDKLIQLTWTSRT